MTTIVVPFYGYLNDRIKKLWDINKLAKSRSLHISNQDDVGANVIALDVQKRKLVYAHTKVNTSSCLIIDLSNLERCTIKKEYNSINAGELKTKKLHHFLTSIILNLVFKNNPHSLSLSLFDARKEQQDNIEQLEAQARKWQSLVSNLLPIKTERA